jgi:hypothetical protein
MKKAAVSSILVAVVLLIAEAFVNTPGTPRVRANLDHLVSGSPIRHRLKPPAA